MRGRIAGFALASTLMVAVVVLLAGFTMAALASFNYNLARQNLLREEAFDAANAGLSLAMSQFIQNSAWGAEKPTDHTGDTLPFTTLPAASDPTAFYVSFLTSGTHAGYPAELPWSVNNFTGAISVSGPPDPVTTAPRQVPAGSALIFVEGVAGVGSQRQVRIIEALLQAPAYPYALAASNSVVTWHNCKTCGWCMSAGSYYATDGYRASRIDGLTPVDVGSIFVGPPKGQTYTGGFHGPCTYGVYLGPGSIVTGAVVHDGPANVATPCPLPPVCCFPTFHSGCRQYCGVHCPPAAACVSTPNPAKGQVLAQFEIPSAGPVACYACPKYYKYSGTGQGYCCLHKPYKYYTVCANGYCPGCPCCTGANWRATNKSHPILNSDTLIVPCGPCSCITLGRGYGNRNCHCLAGRSWPVEFRCDYTLTVKGYLHLPGGVSGRHNWCSTHCCSAPPCCASIFFPAKGTLLILPVPLPSPGTKPTATPDPTLQSTINFWPVTSSAQVGTDASLSILATGNLTLLPRTLVNACGHCDDSVVYPWRDVYTMQGIVTVAGNINDAMGSLHVKGLMLADNPWDATGQWGNILLRDGAWVSYSPTLARGSWVGQTIAPAATQNGLQVIYWREVRPAP
ncbi:MAG TPA: hypothetical protein VGO93_26960 [Candidatus Xenobia bacterium]|jgi:hypothetical protein